MAQYFLLDAILVAWIFVIASVRLARLASTFRAMII